MLVVTRKGYGKCVPADSFRVQNRRSKGALIVKFKSKAGGGGKKARSAGVPSEETDAISNIRLCSADDQVVISTSKGTVIRQHIRAISVQKKTATGVLLQSIADDDYIISVDIVPPEGEGETDGIESLLTEDEIAAPIAQPKSRSGRPPKKSVSK